MADTSRSRKSPRPAHPLAKPRPPARKPAAKRPLPAGEQFFTPGSTGFRRAVERRSATVLVFVYQLPRWLVPVVLVVLLLVGFAVADWRGGLAVLPVFGFVGWLAYMSWPSLRPGGRLLRVALGTFLLLVALTRFGLI